MKKQLAAGMDMDKAKEFLEKVRSGEEAESVSRLMFPPHRPLIEFSLYEFFATRDVRLHAVRPDFIACSFKVPPRLLDGNGNLAMSTITTLIDFLGAAVAYKQVVSSGNVSVDVSISRISTAKSGDELEMTSRFLGRKGGTVERMCSYGTRQVGKLLLKDAIPYLIVSAM